MLVSHIKGFLRLVHLLPSSLTAGIYALLYLLASHGKPNILLLTTSALGMLFMQFSISSLNDWSDYKADRNNLKKDKPLVKGTFTRSFSVGITWLFGVLAVFLYSLLGIQILLIASFGFLLGILYDLGIKNTPFGGLCLGIALPVLPIIAWKLCNQLNLLIISSIPIGMALGIGLHLADALPDAEADAAAGAHGLTQALGRAALPVCWGAFVMAALIVAGLAVAHPIPAHRLALIVLEAVALGAVAAAIISFQQLGSEAARWRRNFILLIVAALAVVVAWFTVIA